MNLANIALTVVTGVVSSGAGAVVGNAIKASTPADTLLVKKVMLGVGGLTLSGMVGSQASKYAAEQIHTTVAQIRELKDVFPPKNDN